MIDSVNLRAEEDVTVEQFDYEEPILLGAEDLQDVTGGCAFNCSNGSCKPPV